MLITDKEVIERKFKFKKGSCSSFSHETEQEILKKLGPIGESKLPPTRYSYLPVYRSAVLSIEKEDIKKELKQLNKTMLLLLELILEMSLSFTHRLTVEMKYLNFSQTWLAKRLGVSREWVSKCLTRLERLGYLKVFRGRDKSGKFKVNVYLPSRKLIAMTNLSRRSRRVIFSIYGIISNIMKGLTKFRSLERLINEYRITYYRYLKSKRGIFPSLILYGIDSHVADVNEVSRSVEAIEKTLQMVETGKVALVSG